MTLAKIVYASMTGNTEEIADIVAEALENLGLEVEINECTQVDASDFEDADLCIVATYTYDEGQLPDEIMDFYDDLGVCGSGDTFYYFYCKAIDDFEERFLKTGAKKGASSVKVDLAAEEEDIQNLEAFAKELVESLNG